MNYYEQYSRLRFQRLEARNPGDPATPALVIGDESAWAWASRHEHRRRRFRRL